MNTVITLAKDIYAKKPEPASLLTATAAAAPFTLMKAPNGSRKQTHFHDGEFLSERIDKLTKTFYRTDMEGKTTKKPMNPTSLAPDIEKAEMDPGQENVTLEAAVEKDGPGKKTEDSKEEEEDFPIEEDQKEESSIKVPPQGGLSIRQS